MESAFNLHVKIAHPDINGMNGMITRLEDRPVTRGAAIGLLWTNLKQSGFGKASIKDLKIIEKIKKIYKDFTA